MLTAVQCEQMLQIIETMLYLGITFSLPQMLQQEMTN